MNNKKASQLMTFKLTFVIQLRMIWKKLKTEANVNDPFEEYVKQVEVKPSDNTSAEIENEMNVDVIG
jgi:hypothetical protein